MPERVPPETHAQPGVHLERLVPSPMVWVVVAALGVCAWLIVLPMDRTAAAVTGAVVVAVASALLLRTSPVVGVRDGSVIAGRAAVPVELVASVEALDTEATRQALGPELDARSMLRIRPWVHTAVRVTLADPDDPVPAWVVSTRHPDAFAAAVTAARATRPS